MFSTMMMVASTSSPKSRLPMESRLALSPRASISSTAKKKAKGMVAATTTAPRRSPRNSHWMTRIRITPTMMLCTTIFVVVATSSSRSYSGTRRTPGGSTPPALMRASSCCTPRMVGMVCSPRRISTVASTTSSSRSWPAMPRRGSAPVSTRATSESRIGVPSALARRTMLRMSSSERIRPMPCTTAACGPMAMVPAPTVRLPARTLPITCGSERPCAFRLGRSITTE